MTCFARFANYFTGNANSASIKQEIFVSITLIL